MSQFPTCASTTPHQLKRYYTRIQVLATTSSDNPYASTLADET